MFARRRKQVPELNSTSTADISFMLLIFFLVTSSMDTDKGLARQLPQPDSQLEEQDLLVKKRNVMQLKLDADNRLTCNGEPITTDDLTLSVADFVANEAGNTEKPEMSEREVHLLGKCMVSDRHVIFIEVDPKAAYYAYFDMQNAYVTLKISEINFEDEKKKEEAISYIARFANSQTQIKESDLAANIGYMLKLDDISKSEWTPVNSVRRNTQWFFERMRGQYDNAKGEPRTKKAKDFVAQHPKKQRFTKTDIAKWEMAWAGRPDIASKGGEQSFDFFHKKSLKTNTIIVDRNYFHQLIAKAIIYQSISDICKQNGIKGYVNIICNYVLATLAWKSRENLDLDYIWNHQEIHPAMRIAIEQEADIVNKYILKLGQEGVNPSVKAKNEPFWKDITLRMVGLPELDKVLLSSNEDELTAENQAKIEQFEKLPADTWRQLAIWGKDARKLSLLERKKLDHAYALASNDKKLPFNIISDVMEIYKKSQDLGYTPQASLFDNE